MPTIPAKKYKLIIFLLTLLLFIVLPLRSALLFNGLPLTHYLNVFFVLFLILLFFVLEWKDIDSKTLRRVAAVLITLNLLKIALHLILLPHGLIGYYYNNKDFSGNFEKSTEFRNLNATRIDKNISFYNVGYTPRKKPFNLWFFNNDPVIENYDFSILWKGFVYVPEECDLKFSALSTGECRLYIDNNAALNKILPLTQGFHNIEVEYINKRIEDDVLDLQWDLKGKPKTINSRYLYPDKPSHLRLILDSGAHYLFFAMLFLKFLALLFIRITCVKKQKLMRLLTNERFLLFSFFTTLTTIAFFKLLKSASSPLFNILSRRDDWLTFESHSRMILFGDWLDKTEAPFYFVPFYRYFLALVHFIFGENLFMAYWVQSFLVFGSALIIYKIAKRLFNTNVAMLSLLLFSFNALPNTVAKSLLSEPLGTFFSCASIYYLIKSLDTNKSKPLFVSGILLGLAIITRPNILVYLLFIAPWLYFFLKNNLRSKAIKYTVLFITAAILIIAPVTIRNYITGRKLCLLTSAVGMNVWEGNMPPSSINFEGIEKNKVYNTLRLDPKVRQVFEYARQKPRLFTEDLLAKLSFIAGWDIKNLSRSVKNRIYWDKLFVFLFFIAGYWLALCTNKNNFKKGIVPTGTFAIIAIITLIIVKPTSYGWRMQLPALPFMLMFSAFLIDKLQNKNVSFTNPLFYANYLFVIAMFYLLTGNTLFPFAAGFYSLFYFLKKPLLDRAA